MSDLKSVRDIDLVVAMRAARMTFADGILCAAKVREKEMRRQLTSDSVFQIAEFFFLLQCHGIRTRKQIRAFGMLHNDYLRQTIASPEKLERLDRTKSQIDGAFFTDVGIEKMVENFHRKPPGFDQSDLCRFLVTQQSFENCRRSLKLLRETRLLQGTRIAYGSIILHSNGTLERIYRNHVNMLRSKMSCAQEVSESE